MFPRTTTALLCFVLALCWVAAPSSSHFSETAPRRTIILSQQDDRLIAQLRVPVPLILARELDWARTVSGQMSSGLVVATQTDLLFDPAGVARDPVQFQSLLEASHLWQVDGRAVGPALLGYRLDVEPSDGPFGSASEAAATLALPSLGVAMPLGLSVVEFRLDLGPAPAPGRPVLVSTGLPSLGLPGWALVDNLLIDDRRGSPIAVLRHGALQSPERLDASAVSVWIEHLGRGAGLGLWLGLVPFAVLGLAAPAGRGGRFGQAAAALAGLVGGGVLAPASPLGAPVWAVGLGLCVLAAGYAGLRWRGRAGSRLIAAVLAGLLAGLVQGTVLRLGGIAAFHPAAGLGLGLGTGLVCLAGLGLGAALARQASRPAHRAVAVALASGLAVSPLMVARSAPVATGPLPVTERIGQAAAWANAAQLQPSLAEMLRDIHLACSGQDSAAGLGALMDSATVSTTTSGGDCAALAFGGLDPAGPPLHELQFGAINLTRPGGGLAVSARWTALALIDPASHDHIEGATYTGDFQLSATPQGWRITGFSLAQTDLTRRGQLQTR